MNQTFVITAAGGNGTAIRILECGLSRMEYASQGKQLGKDGEQFGAEQAGFLIPSENHFEMAGGEFCGNAARSAAILLSEIEKQDKVFFRMSGYDGTVIANVKKTSPTGYSVRCIFGNLPTDQSDVVLLSGQAAAIVDLGGIVHIVIEASFPNEASLYQSIHRAIIQELDLKERGAVGVVWFERSKGKALIHPVVWVKEVDTFFYEQSCGSGSIAVGKVTGISSITQPSGEDIEVEIATDSVALQSAMEIVHEN